MHSVTPPSVDKPNPQFPITACAPLQGIKLSGLSKAIFNLRPCDLWLRNHCSSLFGTPANFPNLVPRIMLLLLVFSHLDFFELRLTSGTLYARDVYRRIEGFVNAIMPSL